MKNLRISFPGLNPVGAAAGPKTGVLPEYQATMEALGACGFELPPGISDEDALLVLAGTFLSNQGLGADEANTLDAQGRSFIEREMKPELKK